MQAIFADEKVCNKINGNIQCEKPNNSIYKFEGSIQLSGVDKMISLGVDNMLLRGSKLKNTEYIIGITVFTGH